MPHKAPTRCNEPGCSEISTVRGRCEDHQRKPWEGRPPMYERYGMSGSEWQALVRRVLIRDGYVCQACGLPGADTADHIIPVSEGGSRKDLSNLRALHQEPCHREKTQEEARRGSARARAARVARGS